MDFEDRSGKLKKWTAKGVRFVRDRVTEKNMGSLLGAFVGAGDVIIDLAWNIDACEILDWCHRNGVLYVNTSTELWDPYAAGPKQHPTEKTLYWRHMNVRRMMAKWKTKGPTAVLEHGANPGLISHFTKQGLIDIGTASDRRPEVQRRKTRRDRQRAHRRRSSGTTSRATLGVKVIHCSERDTQISDKPKQVDEFVNTWSIEGFREEGQTTAEMGWGTHEKWLPPYAYTHKEGPKNQICLARMGMNTWVRTWVPNYAVQGMVVRHGEAFTISDHLTVWEKGKAVYRPTVHYAYCPSDAAIASLNEMRGYDYKLDRQPAHHERRDHRRVRHPRRAADGPSVQVLVDRQRPQHRGVAPPRAAPERHDDAGRHLRRRRDRVDDPEPVDGRRRPRRPAARVRARDREAVPRQLHLDAVRLDAAHELPGTRSPATTSRRST